MQQNLSFERQVTYNASGKYLLHLPPGYGEAGKAQRWPLILFLHGAGERGDNLKLVKTQGLAKLLERRADFPFIVVSPQCPEDQWWSDNTLIALLDHIIASHAVDEARIYLTGMSMGASGAWSLAAHHTGRFAALAPICGRAATHWVWNLHKLPIWVFHGTRDDVVPIEESERMVRALKKAGCKVKYTVYPDAAHDAWTQTYDNDELYQWFLTHKRKL